MSCNAESVSDGVDFHAENGDYGETRPIGSPGSSAVARSVDSDVGTGVEKAAVGGVNGERVYWNVGKSGIDAGYDGSGIEVGHLPNV
jgi:hypothetical protein